MAERSAKPLVAYPNSGERYDPLDKRWKDPAAAQPLWALSRSWFESGARLIGGCCRTTPADISALARQYRT
jgi:homocysteine S-methyltransferase